MAAEIKKLIQTIADTKTLPDEAAVVELLRCQGDDLAALYATADQVRHHYVGDEVYLRGILEFSNFCVKSCDYCGIRSRNPAVTRYRMPAAEIIEQAGKARQWGCTTVVLQSGEDRWFTAKRLCEIIRAIREKAGVAVTLSIGERPLAEYRQFREAGCNRYLLRFETSDRDLFARIHPDDDFDQRLDCLRNIRLAGIQTGSGFMIGLPFSGLETIARDILFATDLRLDMIGCGPFIANPQTPLSGQPPLDDKEVYFKAIAIVRLLNPLAHIPATTAFDALCPGGRDLLLQRGANIFMPNLTPQKYRAHYLLYPNKPCVDEDGEKCSRCVVNRIRRLNRKIGTGPGHSLVQPTQD